MVKFDGKHWIAKRTREGPLRIHSYEHAADIANKSLGEGGIVAIPNARPDEYRYGEFHGFARRSQQSGNIIDLLDGRVFYDRKRDIYFMKAQEVNTIFNGVPITFLIYNLSYRQNFKEEGYSLINRVNESKGIVGITGPSCVSNNLENIFAVQRGLLGNIDFFVGYSSSAALSGTNEKSLDFYVNNIRYKEFVNPFTQEQHKVGVIAVSGGHRTPYGLNRFIFGQTIGRSYTEFDGLSEDNFITYLRDNLRNSRIDDLTMRPTIAETIRHAVSIKVIDKFRK